MGNGLWNQQRYRQISDSKGYSNKSHHDIFQSNLHDNLNPSKMKNNKRESRDSEEHPRAIPIIIALDVTGSMQSIPENLVKNELPKLMDAIVGLGINDPQIMFMGIGDDKCDDTPLQISQFESSTEKIDECLTKIFLEGRGGGNHGESYALAWLVAGYHTETDHFEKRKQKGFLFTIGNENIHPIIEKNTLVKWLNASQEDISDISYLTALSKAAQKYHIFHINIPNHADLKEIRERFSSMNELTYIECEENQIIDTIITSIRNTLKSSVEDQKTDNSTKQTFEDVINKYRE